MYVQCSPLFRQQIEQNKSILVGKHDENCKVKYVIKNHLPEAHYAVRLKYNGMVKSILVDNQGKDKAQQTRFQFKGDNFYVNGQKVVDKVTVPTLKEVLELSPARKSILDLIQFVHSNSVQEKGSTFPAFAAQVENINQIQNCYLKLKSDHMEATHIALGYSLLEDGERIQGAQSDGEHQADVKILEAFHRTQIVGVAVFVAHWYGGIQLGGLRLSLVHQCALKVLDQFTYAKYIPEYINNDKGNDNETSSDDSQADHEDGQTSDEDTQSVQSRTSQRSSYSQKANKLTKKSGRGRGGLRGRGRGGGRGRCRGVTQQTKMKVNFL